MKMKKAEVDPMKIIMLAVILIAVVIIVLVIFRNLFGKEAAILEEKIGGLEDCDGDGIPNFLDKCPCDPENKEGCKTKLVDPVNCICE